MALLNHPFVVHPRSIAGQPDQIKTGYGLKLRTSPAARITLLFALVFP